jgi:hypothetical protein
MESSHTFLQQQFRSRASLSEPVQRRRLKTLLTIIPRCTVGVSCAMLFALCAAMTVLGQSAPSQTPQAQPDQSERIDNMQAIPADQAHQDLLKLIDPNTATVTGAGRALKLFQGFTDQQFQKYFAACPPTDASPKVDKAELRRDFFPYGNTPTCDTKVYAVLHLLKWGPSTTDASGTKKQNVLAQNWYLYSFSPKKGYWEADDISKDAHLSGAGALYFLAIQLDADSSALPQAFYTVNVTKKTPANLAHLFAIAQAAGLNSTSSAPSANTRADLLAAARAANPSTLSYWGGGYVVLKYKTSTITVVSSVESGSTTTAQLGQTIYDNEGLLYWDVSFAVPIRKVSQVQVNQVAGTLAPVSVNQQDVLAVVDGYLPYLGLDPSKNVLEHWPHPLAGVGIASQPLHKILVGGAWGPSFSEIYMGVLFVKQPIFPNSNSCSSTPDTTPAPATAYHFCKQFSIGLNLQVSSILDKLTKK